MESERFQGRSGILLQPARFKYRAPRWGSQSKPLNTPL